MVTIEAPIRKPRPNAAQRGSIGHTEAEDRRYHLAMASLCAERGFRGLAKSYRIAAFDCPKGCGCKGCRGPVEEPEARRPRGREVAA